jgi:hypothetical protein
MPVRLRCRCRSGHSSPGGTLQDGSCPSTLPRGWSSAAAVRWPVLCSRPSSTSSTAARRAPDRACRGPSSGSRRTRGCSATGPSAPVFPTGSPRRRRSLPTGRCSGPWCSSPGSRPHHAGAEPWWTSPATDADSPGDAEPGAPTTPARTTRSGRRSCRRCRSSSSRRPSDRRSLRTTIAGPGPGPGSSAGPERPLPVRLVPERPCLRPRRRRPDPTRAVRTAGPIVPGQLSAGLLRPGPSRRAARPRGRARRSPPARPARRRRRRGRSARAASGPRGYRHGVRRRAP